MSISVQEQTNHTRKVVGAFCLCEVLRNSLRIPGSHSFPFWTFKIRADRSQVSVIFLFITHAEKIPETEGQEAGL